MPFARSLFTQITPIAALILIAAVSLFATSSVTVLPGDTLTRIAASHDVTIAELVDWNDLDDPDRIVAGDTLLLGPASTVTGAATAASADGHVVTAGETLSMIARRYGASVAQLVAANDLTDPDRIIAGTTLVVASGAAPAAVGDSPEPSASEPAPAMTHVVEAGDTVFAIATRFQVSVQDLSRANGIIDPHLLQIGQSLVIPSTSDEPTAGEPEPPSDSASEAAEAVASPGSVKAAFQSWSSGYGVDQATLEALAWVESDWQPTLVGPNGELGIAQLPPATLAFIEDNLIGRSLDPLDTSDGVQLAARYLRFLQDSTETEWDALAAWHQGLTSLLEHGPNVSGTEFADRVVEIRRMRS